MYLIVDPRKVGDSGTLTNSAEFIIDGTVAEANPALVCTKVRNRDAAKMSADSRAADD